MKSGKSTIQAITDFLTAYATHFTIWVGGAAAALLFLGLDEDVRRWGAENQRLVIALFLIHFGLYAIQYRHSDERRALKKLLDVLKDSGR